MPGLYKVLPLKPYLLWRLNLRRRNPRCYGGRARAIAAWFMGEFSHMSDSCKQTFAAVLPDVEVFCGRGSPDVSNSAFEFLTGGAR
jgi:hypothetical protein